MGRSLPLVQAALQVPRVIYTEAIQGFTWQIKTRHYVICIFAVELHLLGKNMTCKSEIPTIFCEPIKYIL